MDRTEGMLSYLVAEVNVGDAVDFADFSIYQKAER